MKLNDYMFVAGKNGSSGLLDYSSELNILTNKEFESFDPAFRFSGGAIMVPILIDLRATTYVDKVIIRFADAVGGIEKIDFSKKTDRSELYKISGTVFVDDQTVEFDFSDTARFIKLVIYKGEWTPCSPGIEIHGSVKGDFAERLSDDDYRIEWMKLPPKVDRYGQYLYEEWEGKIHTDRDLVERYREEKEYLKNVENSKYQHDEYGGIIDGKNYGGTGYFRTQKIDGRWWLITPLGNKFIIKGTEAANLTDGPGLSRIHYKDTDIVRSVYSELPDPNEFPEAYSLFFVDKKKCVNLLLANLIKKYGRENYVALWREITMKRLKKWNFNTHAKWSKDEGIKLPYICSTGTNDSFPLVSYAADPYDENFEKNVTEAIRNKATALKDDPLLIGYHFTNESGWTPNVVRTILESDGNTAAKRAFVKFIFEKYNTEELKAKFEVDANSVEEFENIPLKIESLTSEEINEFIFASSAKFHSIVRKVFKKLDPNHLYMGGGLPGSNWRNSVAWTEGSAEYCDVITFDRYSRELTDYLKPYLHIDKPMANIEWSFISNQRGYGGGALARVLCNNQAERAEWYCKTVEAHMKIPQIVGMGWFLHYDQPLTGRALNTDENAECYNFGLVDMQDTPYYEFVDKISLMNDELEKIHENG